MVVGDIQNGENEAEIDFVLIKKEKEEQTTYMVVE